MPFTTEPHLQWGQVQGPACHCPDDIATVLSHNPRGLIPSAHQTKDVLCCIETHAVPTQRPCEVVDLMPNVLGVAQPGHPVVGGVISYPHGTSSGCKSCDMLQPIACYTIQLIDECRLRLTIVFENGRIQSISYVFYIEVKLCHFSQVELDIVIGSLMACYPMGMFCYTKA